MASYKSQMHKFAIFKIAWFVLIHFLSGRGNVVIGQDQDAVGGKFSESESFLGEMAYVDIWSRILEPQEVITNMESCSNESNFGDLYGWPEMQENVHGDVKVWLN